MEKKTVKIITVLLMFVVMIIGFLMIDFWNDVYQASLGDIADSNTVKFLTVKYILRCVFTFVNVVFVNILLLLFVMDKINFNDQR